MAWRIAESLETLRKQLNAAFPNRSKLSDGGIGDAKHASRSSDHNPHVKDRNGVGIVTARDFTHDPQNGLDCHKLAEWLIESRDPRIKYIIWNRRILSSQNSAWKWRPYSGVNAHTKHLHLSVVADPKLYDSIKLWDLDVAVVETFKPNFDLSDKEINSALAIPQNPASANPKQPQVMAANDISRTPSNPSFGGAVQTSVIAGDQYSGASPALQEPVQSSGNAPTSTADGSEQNLAQNNQPNGTGSPDSKSTQTAENITNVDNSTKTVPDNFTPQNIEVSAPPPSGMMAKAAYWVGSLGIGVPSLAGALDAVKSWTADGTINVREMFAMGSAVAKFVFPYAVYLGIAFVVFWGIKELMKQISLMLKIYITGRADTHNVEVIPIAAPVAETTWKQKYFHFLGY